jgi:hypothetical protein
MVRIVAGWPKLAAHVRDDAVPVCQECLAPVTGLSQTREANPRFRAGAASPLIRHSPDTTSTATGPQEHRALAAAKQAGAVRTGVVGVAGQRKSAMPSPLWWSMPYL